MIKKTFQDYQNFLDLFREQSKKNLLIIILFLGMMFNLFLAPIVYAANGVDLTRKAAYAIGLSILLTVALSVYLFFVIVQPERF